MWCWFKLYRNKIFFSKLNSHESSHLSGQPAILAGDFSERKCKEQADWWSGQCFNFTGVCGFPQELYDCGYSRCPRRLTFLLGVLEYKELLLLFIHLFAFNHHYKLPVTTFFYGEKLEFVWVGENTQHRWDLTDFLCILQLNCVTHILILVFSKSMNIAIENNCSEMETTSRSCSQSICWLNLI